MFHFRNSFKLLSSLRSTPIASSQARTIKRWVAPTMKELRSRREKMGPEPLRPRSSFLDWNYGAEIFSFQKRLNEEFDKDLLQQSLTHRSYIIKEEQRQKELGIEQPDLGLKDNRKMIEDGNQLLSNYVNAFLLFSYPKLPSIGIKAIHDYLLSDDLLAHVSSHIGTKDLILTEEFPIEKTTLANTFKAVVSALQQSTDDGRAFLFVRDFVLTQLNQKDIQEIWEVDEPLQLLTEICQDLGMGVPEPRSIGQCGKNTILACSYVGLYCNKKLLSKGFGENVHMAVKVAALNGLNKLCKTEEWSKPLNFSVTLDEVVALKKSKRSNV
uniref:Large ribosomal subunit protein mL44 n=1 Tax=Culicoides sonorensis TaxID=179676 RepID=A0A336LLF6_CULSO